MANKPLVEKVSRSPLKNANTADKLGTGLPDLRLGVNSSDDWMVGRLKTVSLQTPYQVTAFCNFDTGKTTIAKNANTFAKRQREMEKKRKAEEKRQRRIDRKASGVPLPLPPADAHLVDDPHLVDTDESAEL